MYRQTNSITINKTANGWAVQLPVIYEEDNSSISRDIMSQMMPLIREALKLQSKDPVMEEIYQKNQEPEVQLPKEAIVADDGVYVFRDFKEVMALLEERFGE